MALRFGLETMDHADGLSAPAGIARPVVATNVKVVRRRKTARTSRVRPRPSFPDRKCWSQMPMLEPAA